MICGLIVEIQTAQKLEGQVGRRELYILQLPLGGSFGGFLVVRYG